MRLLNYIVAAPLLIAIGGVAQADAPRPIRVAEVCMASKSGLLLNLRVSSMYKYRGDYVKTFGTSKTVSEMMSVLCDYTEGCSATLVNLTAAESGSLSLLDVTSSEGPVLSVGANMVTAQLEGGIVTVDLLTKHVTWAVSKENYERRSSGTCPR